MNSSQTRSINQQRRTAVIEWLVVTGLAIALVAGATGGRVLDSQATVTRTIEVRSGDTLWEIAAANPIAGLSTAETVEVLTRLNRLDSAALAVGAEVVVPAPDGDPQALALR